MSIFGKSPKNTFTCLLIETTSPKGSIGIYSFFPEKKQIQQIKVRRWESLAHSSVITSAFSEIKKELDTKENIFVSVGVGPGRFTGVRVGISFAKTICFSLKVPCYPMSSLKILAESVNNQEKPVLVLLNAFKNSLYMALYQKNKELISPCVIAPEDLSKKITEESICVGDGYEAYVTCFSPELKKKLQVKVNIFPEVKYLASLLKKEFNSSLLIHWKELQPVYIRSPVESICPN